jgi:hypothetical protein
MAINTSSPILDFTVPDLHNLFTIGIADSSYYPPGFAIINPTLEITAPSFPKVTLPYNTGNLNIFNSNDLNLTCVSDPGLLAHLPDGIWTIKMTVNPILSWFKEKSFLRTTEIRYKVGVALMNTDLVVCTQDLKKQKMAYLDEIYYSIDCAVAAANQCNSLVAMTLYQQAHKMLHNLINNKPNFYMNPSYYLAGG